ncbi:MAG: hypothetical protein PHY47_28605 [Lachnospiraceae bacterium]|nr:hypothetical protein [Lachnospiraceae bacterium]
MGYYQIEIDETEIQKQIEKILTTILNAELKGRYSDSGKVMSEAVKDLVYSHKDEIIDKVVDRSVAEITRKGMKKFLDAMTKE